ncbi:MAG: 3-methyl-2-oxobutanoate hydroxymethyltransferase, partial [Gemmatimonadetes bacterium]|nr:3-methyl-2-oxobutanoate hydroxymethyltransferase [Gemmatimonadota bacterium]
MGLAAGLYAIAGMVLGGIGNVWGAIVGGLLVGMIEVLSIHFFGADMVKLDGAADFPEAVRAVVRAGIPVFAQFGITPQTAQLMGGIDLA